MEQETKQNAFTLEVDEEGIATLTFDDPGARVNTLTSANMQELEGVVSELERRSDITGLVFRSGKSGTFIVGADVKEIAGIEEEREAVEKVASGQELLDRIEDLPFTTMALIQGDCYGGGTELALAFDMRVASDHRKTAIGLPEVNLGIIPGFAGTYRLQRRVGLIQAVQMITSGKPADGKKAAKIRLTDATYPDAFHEEWARALLKKHLGEKRPASKAKKYRRKRRLGQWFLEATWIGRRLLFSRSKKEIIKRTDGKYPAPLSALRVLSRNYRSSRKRALERERRAFAKLAVSREAKNLIGVFFAQEQAKRHPIITKGEKQAPVERAAVLGAGVMGGTIAWLFSKMDTPVVMKDIAWDAVHKGYAAAADIYGVLREKGRYSSADINLKMNKIHGTLDYGALGRPDMIVEAVVEKMGVKKQVLQETEAQVDADAVMATNTSALSVSEMGSALKYPERFGGMHFFNPANRMPLVEVVRGRDTSTETLKRIATLALSMGKTPVIVADGPGFLVNRILMPYLNEALFLFDEGVSVEKTDGAFRDYGMPMGPFRLIDEVGIDVARDVAETLTAHFSDRMETGAFFEKIDGSGELLGKKSGKGFYVYGGKGKPSLNAEIAAYRGAGTAGAGSNGRAPDATDTLYRPLLSMVNEAARCLDDGIVDSPAELDLAMIMGTGFPAFRGGLLRWADSLGLEEVENRLKRYADRHGKRFAPARGITSRVKEGKGFHDR